MFWHDDKTYTKHLEAQDFPALGRFCQRCEELGYQNNASFKAMKIEQMMMDDFGHYFVTYDAETESIFSINGVQHLPMIDLNCWRILTRMCMLPEYSWRAKKETTTKGLKRANNHHNSFILSDIVPLQVEWTRTHHDDPMFVFTAKSELEENDTAGKGKLVNRIIKYHARVPNSGITVLHEHYELYHALQNIFLVDVDQFAAYQKATR